MFQIVCVFHVVVPHILHFDDLAESFCIKLIVFPFLQHLFRLFLHLVHKHSSLDLLIFSHFFSLPSHRVLLSSHFNFFDFIGFALLKAQLCSLYILTAISLKHQKVVCREFLWVFIVNLVCQVRFDKSGEVGSVIHADRVLHLFNQFVTFFSSRLQFVEFGRLRYSRAREHTFPGESYDIRHSDLIYALNMLSHVFNLVASLDKNHN